MILAGDIGGTHTRLAVFTLEGERLTSISEETFPSRSHSGLTEIVSQYLSTHRRSVSSACFGVAGPIKHNRCEATNLPWVVDAQRLASELHIPIVQLINDLEANAYGIGALEPGDFVTLNPGAPEASGNRAVISVGTGLGEAGLYWDGRQHHPFACEGGHVDFSPRNQLEVDLLFYLQARFEHDSYERVLSGPGLHWIYQFLRDTRRGEESPAVVSQFATLDPSAVVSRAGLAGESTLCMQALDLFASLYGAEAGNLALKTMATGGVFLGGGIAPKILPKLQEPGFLAGFAAKGRMKALLETMPVRVILRDNAALLGAASCAAEGLPGGR